MLHGKILYMNESDSFRYRTHRLGSEMLGLDARRYANRMGANQGLSIAQHFYRHRARIPEEFRRGASSFLFPKKLGYRFSVIDDHVWHLRWSEGEDDWILTQWGIYNSSFGEDVLLLKAELVPMDDRTFELATKEDT